MAAVAACWGSMLALSYQSQSAAPLMQAGMLALVLLTTAYAPLALLQPWLRDVARINPVTQVVEAARQGFVGGVTWAETWPGLLALAGLLVVLGAPRAARDAPHALPERERAACAGEIASGCCGGTGPRASATGGASPTPGPAPAATRGSGTGTPASRRSSGAASSRRGHGPSWRACSPPSDRTASSATRSSGAAGLAAAAPLLQRRLAALVADRDDPAAAARLGLADRGRRPGGGAADRRPGRLARRQPRPRGRRPALDPAARRVRARRLAEVRPGLGLALQRPHRLPAAGPPQPQPRLRRPAGPRARRAAALRDRWSTRSGRSRCRRWAAPRRPRRWSSASGTSAAASSSTRRSPAARGPASLTWAALAPLALPDLPEEIGRRLVEEHLLNEGEFLTPVAPPSVSARRAGYEPGGGRGPIRRYWRGPTWVNSAWLVWLGMRRLGYEAEARAPGRRPDRRGRARRAARVLRPARRQGPGRQRLRLVGAGGRVGATREPAATICSGR